MKTLILLLLPIISLSQGTFLVNLNVGIESKEISLQTGIEHFFKEDMSIEVDYIKSSSLETALATLNYSVLGTKDFNLQAKAGMTLDKNITGGLSFYYQVKPFINVGVNSLIIMKESNFTMYTVGVSFDLFQVL